MPLFSFCISNKQLVCFLRLVMWRGAEKSRPFGLLTEAVIWEGCLLDSWLGVKWTENIGNFCCFFIYCNSNYLHFFLLSVLNARFEQLSMKKIKNWFRTAKGQGGFETTCSLKDKILIWKLASMIKVSKVAFNDLLELNNTVLKK